MKSFALLVLSAFLSSSISAQEATGIDTDKLIEKLKANGAVEDQMARLQGYDDILREFDLMTPANSGDGSETVIDQPETPPDLTPSAWKSWVDTDPIDDSKVYYFQASSDTSGGLFDGPVVLIVRGNNDGAELYISWHTYLGNDSDDYRFPKKNVTFRIGKNPAQTIYWNNSTNN